MSRYLSRMGTMKQLITILALVFAGLPGLGGGLVGGPQREGVHQASGGPRIVALMPCCAENNESHDCSMRGGACRCSAPVRDPQPTPDAPLPKPVRDSITALPDAQTGVVSIPEPEAESPRRSTGSLKALSGFTHNEIQALLGVWRT